MAVTPTRVCQSLRMTEMWGQIVHAFMTLCDNGPLSCVTGVMLLMSGVVVASPD